MPLPATCVRDYFISKDRVSCLLGLVILMSCISLAVCFTIKNLDCNCSFVTYHYMYIHLEQAFVNIQLTILYLTYFIA